MQVNNDQKILHGESGSHSPGEDPFRTYVRIYSYVVVLVDVAVSD
jgi:hypothetical protein